MDRANRWLAGLAVWLTLAAACIDDNAEGDDVADEGDSFDLSGGFAFGINLPWLHYGHDFGTTAWGHDGVSHPDSFGQLDADLGFLADHGVRVLRWFVFGDGRASPELDADGFVVGYDAFFFADFDAMLALLEAHDLYVIPVLFDFLWMAEGNDVNGVLLGGRAGTISDVDKRGTLMTQALAPLFEAYGSHPRILAWDIINEPEWGMRIAGGQLAVESIGADEMLTFVGDVLATAHGRADQPLTVGSANLPWMLSLWVPVDLDILQFHYYEDVPFQLDVPGLGLTRPVLVGEFPTARTPLDLSATLDGILAGDFAGALPWSLNGDDDRSDIAGQAEVLAEWWATHLDEP